MPNNENVKYIVANPYKSASFARNHALVKTTAICVIMEYFANSISLHLDTYKTHQELRELVFKQTSFKKNDINIASVDTAIYNMAKLGYLLNEGDIYTPQGSLVDAYRSQSFQNQCANLYQAEASRRLSKIAILIALGGFIISCAGFIMSYLF